MMAFIVEIGQQSPDSNAYVSTAFVDDYQSSRGRVDWSNELTLIKEAAIIRATDYIDQRFGKRFRGYKRSKIQALEWPRNNASDNDNWFFMGEHEIPPQLKKACAEYALIALRIGELLPNPPLPVNPQSLTANSSQTILPTGVVVNKREKVGPIEEETKYQSSAESQKLSGILPSKSSLVNSFFIPEYPIADLWMEELLTNPYSRTFERA